MENLIFASRIKNTARKVDHKHNVCRVASLLGIQACLSLKTNRLSGGQYKRVSIAQELLSQPDILILDEPTSGLDSLTCYRTVSVLRDLVNMSRKGLISPLAIVMTIHQPQIKIFNLFHHVYVLSSMGRCVYEGRPEYLIETVASQCQLLPPPDDRNPATFIIDLASEVYGREPIEQLVQLQYENFLAFHNQQHYNFLQHHQHHYQHQHHHHKHSLPPTVAESKTKIKDSVQILISCHDINSNLPQPDNNQVVDATPSSRLEETSTKQHHLSAAAVHKQQQDTPNSSAAQVLRVSPKLRKRHSHEKSFWLHTSLLVKRHWISTWRDSLLTTTRVAFHVIIPFIFYFVYSHKSGSANACPYVERELDIHDLVSDTNIQRLTTQHDELILTFENVSLFFLLLYSFSMCVLAVTALSFPLNMQILLKETNNGWYTMPRFVMAKTLADLPIELTMPVISVSIAYAITGQPSSYFCWRMLSVTAVMTLCSLISQTQGLLFGAYFMNNVQAAVFVSQASTLPWIMLSGFTTRISQLPKLLQWLSFGSIYRLGIESIVAVRYGFGMCACNQSVIDGTPTKVVGIPDQLRSLMRYYMDVYDESQTTPTTTITPSSSSSSNNATQSDMFERIGATLSRANTFGVEINSCKDVRPFIMSAREVDETTLPIFVSILIIVLIALKILLFYVVRIRTG